MPVHGFGREDRILKRSDYQRIKEEGLRFRTRNFGVNYQVSSAGRLRLGVIVAKGIRRASGRNRAKRLVREFFRLNRAEIRARFCEGPGRGGIGLELVVICYPGAEKLSYEQVRRELSAGLEQELIKIREA